jgi:hypothetical protein
VGRGMFTIHFKEPEVERLYVRHCVPDYRSKDGIDLVSEYQCGEERGLCVGSGSVFLERGNLVQALHVRLQRLQRQHS